MRYKYQFSFSPYSLHFNEPGGTSRGILTEKFTYFIRIINIENDVTGYGEVPVFSGLSKESPTELNITLHKLASGELNLWHFDYNQISSLSMGIETALNDINHGGSGIIFPSDFINGKTEILINGLIWMGKFEKMLERIDEKLEEHFTCIKIKIGAIDWEKELDLIRYIRMKGGNDVTVRVDANGAFKSDCLGKIYQLADLGVHSIEQPIPAGCSEEMKKLCRQSPVPIALDEELIGLPVGDQRWEILDKIRPQYIILKPALCYGFKGASDWIERAEEMNIGWWITSALESSVGLNAIAQYTGAFHTTLPQGLGTGKLFTNNLSSPLILKGDKLKYDKSVYPMRKELSQLNWI